MYTEHILMIPRDCQSFVGKFGPVYEQSPWIAEHYFKTQKPPQQLSVEALAGGLSDIVEAADETARLALLQAHPDLAGRLARSGTLSHASTQEQKSAGLDNCTEEEYQKFTDLNRLYVHKNGFPFILAVRGRTRQDILQTFETRTNNKTATEFTEALKQVHLIARLRLEHMAEDEARATR